MPHIDAGGVSLYYEAVGPEDGKPVMLIHGLNTPMVAWPEGLVDYLVGKGFRVIRHDNRDVGRSETMKRFEKPNLGRIISALKLGLKPKVPYGIKDMAKDALALMDALEIEEASVVGASMGGMIAQYMATIAPTRITKLCLIMTTSGAPGLSAAPSKVQKLLYSTPSPTKRQAFLDHQFLFWRAIGSKTYPANEEDLKAFLENNFDWAPAVNPAGGLRQLAAVYTDRDRYKILPDIKAPTLVIHGLQDSLVPASGGQDLASRINGAQLLLVPGMGHDFPMELVDDVSAAISAHMKAVDGPNKKQD